MMSDKNGGEKICHSLRIVPIMKGWNSSNSVSLKCRMDYGLNSNDWVGLPELLHLKALP